MIFEMASCGGCRTCEMACSYKHVGEFKPAISSIQILEKESELGYQVHLIEGHKRERIACDSCEGLDVQLCVQYCEKGDDLKKILEEFRETIESKKKEKVNLMALDNVKR
jgi:Fe-S-cluster-containing hydrogenase component 2